jgi:hypothetical protein
MPKIRNPYQRAMYVMWGLIGLFLILVVVTTVMVMLDIWNSAILIVISILFSLFCLVQFIVWLAGQIQVKRIENFLGSTRPLLRWTYTPEEWQAIKDEEWQEEKGDWKVQLGCLTFLFGLVGLLVGLMGVVEGEEINPFVSTAIGIAFGGSIGAAVAGGNYLAAQNEYLHSDSPSEVVLAPTEIFCNGQYFKANGDYSHIESVKFIPGSPSTLLIETYYYPWWLRDREEGVWAIVVPQRLHREVEAILPFIEVSNPDFDV